MKSSILRCMLCGRLTLKHCAYCDEPICQRCRFIARGKSYCSPLHRDHDAGIGHWIRRVKSLVEMS
jgi:hypothetical protein